MEITPPTPSTPVSVYLDDKDVEIPSSDSKAEVVTTPEPKHAPKSVSLTPVSSNPNDPLFDVRKKLFNATRMGRKVSWTTLILLLKHPLTHEAQFVSYAPNAPLIGLYNHIVEQCYQGNMIISQVFCLRSSTT